MAVILTLAVGLLLLAAALLPPDDPSPWIRVVHSVVQWLGPVAVVVLVVYVGRRRVVRWAEGKLIQMAGPALIRSMPPRTVLSALLPQVYGDRTSHEDVLMGVLGGAGRDPAGRDTAVSKNTSAHFRLQAIDDAACLSEATWTHEFSGVRDNHRLVIFATCDPEISRLVRSERIFPLFELWVLDNEDQLEDFVPNLRGTFQVGVSYIDDGGGLNVVEPQALRGEEVALRNYDQFVRLPEGVDRKDLRIMQFDLYDLADPDHVVESVESLSVKASGVFPADLGFFTWTPPHPCLMRSVTFDVSELAREHEKLVYLVVPSTLKRGAVPLSRGWVDLQDHIEVAIDSWMLPGHGVTLLWRPVDGVDPQHAPQAW